MYSFLPFKYTRLDKNKILLVNFVGEYYIGNHIEIEKFINHEIIDISLYEDLKTRHFLCSPEEINPEYNILKVKYYTKHKYLKPNSILLMVVPTIECNCNCVYCQVNSRKNHSSNNFMNFDQLNQFCNFTISLPHEFIKIEFQGGEPSIYPFAVEYIIKRLNVLNKRVTKNIEFVICTNLINLPKNILNLCIKKKMAVSTSIDGDMNIHDKNRPMSGYGSSYLSLVNNFKILNKMNIFPSALLTITKHNINIIEDVINTYISLGLKSIYIRSLNNYGHAFNNMDIGYTIEEFVNCYKKGLNYIIELNKKGIQFREEGTVLLLRKIMTPFCDGVVDMQNPSALGKMCLLVNFNGDIFPSDEARMIAEMGDNNFYLGNISDKFILQNIDKGLEKVNEDCLLEFKPKCSICVYSVYCGADTVRTYYTNIYSHEEFCGKRIHIFDYIFKLLSINDSYILNLFRKWANE